MSQHRLVGRDEELTAVRSWLRGAVGQGGAMVVAGEAGVGKSSLAAAVAAEATAAGWVVVRSRFRDMLEDPGGWLCEVATAATAAGADLSHDRLAGFGSAVGALMGRRRELGAAPSLLAAGGQQFHPAVTAEALVRLVALCPAVKGRLLTVDDVHLADRDDLAVIDRLLDRFATPGLALLLTVRSGDRPEVDVAVERWWAARRADACRLDPLTEPVARELITRLASAPLPDSVVTTVASASGGIPLLIEEIVADLHARPDEPGLAGIEVPRSLAVLVRGRLSRLDDFASALVRLAALGGEEIDDVLLARAAGRPVEEVRAGLDRLWQARLVVRQDGRWRFRHALSADAILAVGPPGALQTLAEQALARLDLPPAESEASVLRLMARLGELAGQPHRAAVHWMRFAGRCLADGALPGVVAVLERAETLAGGNTDLVLTARRHRAAALAATGHVGEAMTIARQLLGASTVPANRDAQLELRLTLARAALVDGRPGDVPDLVGDAGTEAGDSLPGVQLLLAEADVAEGRADSARHRTVAVLVNPSSTPAQRCEAELVIGRLERPVDLHRAAEAFERARVGAAAAGLALWEARAAHEQATLAQLDSLAVEPLHDAHRLAVTAGDLTLLSSIEFHLAAVHGVRFEGADALHWAELHRERAHAMGSPIQRSYAEVLAGQAFAVSGRRREAVAAGAAALASAPGSPEIAGLVAGVCDGLAALLEDDWQVAGEAMRHAIDQLRRVPVQGPLPPYYLAPLLARALGGDSSPATRTEASTLELFPGARAYLALCAAVDAGRAGDPATARDQADRALVAFDELGPAGGGLRALGLWLAARPAHADGWGDPARWLTQAEEFFDGRGLRRAALGCRRERTRLGIRAVRRSSNTRTVPPGLARYGITVREADVARLLADGRTNPDIAALLNVSLRTVKTHVEHLLRRTGTTNRTELAALLLPLLD